MLIETKNENKKGTNMAAFRIPFLILKEFRTLCRKHNIKQSIVIVNAMKLAIKEMKELENAK